MAVIADITEGTVRRDASGWHATRVFDVQGVGGEAKARPYNAAQAVLASEGVAYGEPHPVIPGIRVAAINVEHVEKDPQVYRVTAEYSGDGEGAAPGLVGSGIKGIEVSSSTVRTRGFRDVNGNLMIVTYTGPEFTIQVPGVSNVLGSVEYTDTVTRFVHNSQPQEAEFDLPTVTVTATIERPYPSFLVSRNTATRMNSAAWSGLPAYNWLSLGIDSTLNDSGAYDWRYIFAISPLDPENGTWRFRAENNGFQGRWYSQATVGNGIEFFNVYRSANFDALFGFSLPYA